MKSSQTSSIVDHTLNVISIEISNILNVPYLKNLHMEERRSHMRKTPEVLVDIFTKKNKLFSLASKNKLFSLASLFKQAR